MATVNDSWRFRGIHEKQNLSVGKTSNEEVIMECCRQTLGTSTGRCWSSHVQVEAVERVMHGFFQNPFEALFCLTSLCLHVASFRWLMSLLANRSFWIIREMPSYIFNGMLRTIIG